jgi:hypothetical protein
MLQSSMPNNNEETNNSEVVFVPTPVDPSQFKQLMNSFSSKNIDTKPFEEIMNSVAPESEKIEKVINLQKKDYEKYFDNINKLEYQKVFQTFNNENINKEIASTESQLDYNSIINNINKNATSIMNYPVPIYNPNSNDTYPMIDLPQNKKEVEEFYSKIFNNVNLNNSLSFIQKSNDIDIIDGKVKTYSSTDSKIRKFAPEVIGIADPSQINIKDYKNKQALTKDEIEEKNNLEMEKRAREPYPRFKSRLPFEIKDDEENEQRENLKKNLFEVKFERMKKEDNQNNKIGADKASNSISLIQKIPSKDKLMKAIDIIISKRNSFLKSQARYNLANCKRSCDKSCVRVSKIKGETLDYCKVKCYLACSNNTLNKLLN